ncbi:MAG: glutamine-hydrolyzing GMP synthase [Candidatus Altimarinota bacterium]
MENTIAILDFGGQYAHLITNRIRRLGVYAVILPHDTPASELKNYSGIILSGGPQSVNAEHALVADPDIFVLNIPVLGICYGHQLTNKTLGGKISPGKTKEYGKTKLYIDRKEGLFEGIEPDELKVWMSHWDEVTEIPTSFTVLAHTDNNDFAAVGNTNKHIYGIQFHPEVTHTELGQKVLENFVNLTKAEKTWSTANYLEYISQQILQHVDPSGRKVFMLVSGGVDSVVAFTLLNKVLGEDKVYGLLVDTGFMRKGEIDEVMSALRALNMNNLHVYDAKQDFYEALKGVAEPERKRQIIGKKFIDIQAKAIHEMGLDPDHWILGQGTIYPDTIESGGTKHADKIKTHHNRVPEIQELMDQGLVIEPLAELYKDEVRELGEQLGLPHHLVWRHPFPGPGLAIRILCTPHKVPAPEDLSREEMKVNELLASHHLTGKILPVESVGVQGDVRTYRHPVALSPIDGKTWQDLWNKEELQEISTELTNRFESINRVLFTLHGDASDTSILPDRYLTPDRVATIQEADKIVMDEINRFDLEEKVIWQCPTILLPLASSTDTHESCVLRPVSSIDAMTADFALIPTERLNNILEQLKNLTPSLIFYDLTNKPPGTIEWE